MGWFGSFCSGVASVARSVGSAVVGAAKSIGSAVVNGVGAVISTGTRLFKKAASALKQMTEKVSDWKSLITKTIQGGIAGAKTGFAAKGLWGGIAGAFIGAAHGGYKEYQRQADLYDQQKKQKEEEYEQFNEHNNDTQIDADFERFGQMMNQFIPALQRKFSSTAPVESFEEYLRIDVSMAFIRQLLTKLEKMSDPNELTYSDKRFIELIDKLALDKPMTEVELQEFDNLVKERFGKGLLLIGSERLFSLWTNEEETCKAQVNQQRTEVSRAEIKFKELESRQRYGLPMTEQEKSDFALMQQHIKQTRQEYDKSRLYLSNIRLMTGVAEGLLQQAEAQNVGQVVKESERLRADRAGAILINMERKLDSIHEDKEIPLSDEDKNFLNQYVDLHIPAAIKRKNTTANEYVEVTL